MIEFPHIRISPLHTYIQQQRCYDPLSAIGLCCTTQGKLHHSQAPATVLQNKARHAWQHT
jgi:hypothetical protein